MQNLNKKEYKNELQITQTRHLKSVADRWMDRWIYGQMDGVRSCGFIQEDFFTFSIFITIGGGVQFWSKKHI